MDQSTDKLLRDIQKTVKENHKIIKRLQRDARMSRMWRIIRVLVTLALLFGAYYLVQPLIQNLQNAYQGIQDGFEEIQQTKDSISGFGSLIGGLKKDAE